MGAKLQNLNNQMTPPMGTSSNPAPTTLPQYPTIGANNTNNTPNFPSGKGNVTNSATSGQPKMGQPNNNMRP